MENFKNEINKELYKEQLKSIANNLLNRIDDILADWDKGIRKIHIESTIECYFVPTLKVTKEYNPREVSKDA